MDAPVQPPLGPSDVAPLFEVLTAALSTATETRKQAEAALEAMETRTGFCSCLLEIVASGSAEHSARWLASVQLKNMVVKYWRPRRNAPGITAEEKQHLRGQLLHHINQENNQIAVQMAVIFAKIARHDFPREWPTLFSDLLSLLGGGDLLMQRRVYLVFHHTLKELSSKRLTADQKNFAEITRQLIDHVWNGWCSDTRIIISGLQAALANPADSDKTFLLHFERWLVLLKALRRLLLFGFPNDIKTAAPDPGVTQVLPTMLEALKSLLPMRPAAPRTFSKPLAMLDRGLTKLVKTLKGVQEAHPWAFHRSEALVPALGLMCDTLMSLTRGQSNTLPDSFVIPCVLFIHGVAMCNSYRCSEAGLTAFAPATQEAARAMSAEVKPQLAAFWENGGQLQALAVALVQKFLPLEPSELSDWHREPEVFVSENDSGAWQEQLRGSAESLLLALLEANRETLAPPLVNMLRASNEACPAGAVPALAAAGGETVSGVPTAVILKEAVYNALGVGAFELYDYIDFSEWFTTSLGAEAMELCPAAKPLRRRAILMLGCWVSKLGDHRSATYGILQTALSDSDTVIRLAAVDTLRSLIDDWDFQEEPFMAYTPTALQHLAAFLADATEQETELKIFGLISLIIERLGQSVKPLAQGILALLPQTWDQSESNAMLRIQVMAAMAQMVNILGLDSPMYYSVVVPVLSVATDPSQPDALNMLEDGLVLWLVALRNAPEAHPGLLQIFPNLQAVMAGSTEHIRAACQIMVSAVLLGGPSFLGQYGAILLEIINQALGNVNERGTLLLFPVIETILTCYPEEAPASLEPTLAKLLGMVLGGGEPVTVVAGAAGIFARLLLNRPGDWLGYFQRYALHIPVPAGAPQAASPGESLMLAFVDKWLTELDCIAQPNARKLSGLALSQLLRVHHIGVLERLDSISAAITGLWHEMENGADDGTRIVYGTDHYAIISSGGYGSEAFISSEDAEAEAVRRARLQEADPVNTLKISVLLKAGIQACTELHGENFGRAMQAMDPAIAEQLRVVIGS